MPASLILNYRHLSKIDVEVRYTLKLDTKFGTKQSIISISNLADRWHCRTLEAICQGEGNLIYRERSNKREIFRNVVINS